MLNNAGAVQQRHLFACRGLVKKRASNSDACVTHGNPLLGVGVLEGASPPRMPRHLFPQVC